MKVKLLLTCVVLSSTLGVYGSEQSPIRQAFLAHSLMEDGRSPQKALVIIKEDQRKAIEHQKLYESVQRIADTERELLRRFMSLL